jgi:hypothetical protein
MAPLSRHMRPSGQSGMHKTVIVNVPSLNVSMRWSDSGPTGRDPEDNAFGELVYTKAGFYGPIICGHGGSMWLCRHPCADNCRALEHVREATLPEYRRLKQGLGLLEPEPRLPWYRRWLPWL